MKKKTIAIMTNTSCADFLCSSMVTYYKQFKLFPGVNQAQTLLHAAFQVRKGL